MLPVELLHAWLHITAQQQHHLDDLTQLIQNFRRSENCCKLHVLCHHVFYTALHQTQCVFAGQLTHGQQQEWSKRHRLALKSFNTIQLLASFMYKYRYAVPCEPNLMRHCHQDSYASHSGLSGLCTTNLRAFCKHVLSSHPGWDAWNCVR